MMTLYCNTHANEIHDKEFIHCHKRSVKGIIQNR